MSYVFHVKFSGLDAAKESTENFSFKSCSEVTAAIETGIGTPASHIILTVPDTALIDLATSQAPECSVAPSSDSFWDNFQPHHAVTVRKIYREIYRHLEALVPQAQ